MKYHKLPYDTIWTPDKPISVAYIDDKASIWRTIGKLLQKISKIIQKQKANHS